MGTHLLFKPLRMKIIIFAAILSVALCLPKDHAEKDVQMGKGDELCGVCIGSGCAPTCNQGQKEPKCKDDCKTDADCGHKTCNKCIIFSGDEGVCGEPRKVTNNQCGNYCNTDDECH